MTQAQGTLGQNWRAARPPVAGVHVDSAACSRQSVAVINASAEHARHEAEVGGYVAAEAASPVLEAGRAAVRALAGMSDADVVFTTGSTTRSTSCSTTGPASGVWPVCPASSVPT